MKGGTIRNRSVPFRSIPLRSVPFRSVPFRSVPFPCEQATKCKNWSKNGMIKLLLKEHAWVFLLLERIEWIEEMIVE